MTILHVNEGTTVRRLDECSQEEVYQSRVAIASDDCHFVRFCKGEQGRSTKSTYSPSWGDEDSSVATISTASFSDSDESLLEDDQQDQPRRTVSFAEDLVTDTWTRAKTTREEVADLFYSQEETLRFRQEYRLERKLLNDLSVDPDTMPVDCSEGFSSCSWVGQPARHRISRVVVLHNDRLETFFSPAHDSVKSPNKDDFFDNDSFWSGSLTWY